MTPRLSAGAHVPRLAAEALVLGSLRASDGAFKCLDKYGLENLNDDNGGGGGGGEDNDDRDDDDHCCSSPSRKTVVFSVRP